MSEYCTCATSDYCQVHDEIKALWTTNAQLKARLAEAERLLIDGSRIGMTVGDRANWMIETRDWLGSKRAASDSADEVQK